MTNNAIDSNIPIEITKGGTQRSSLTAHSVLVGNGIAGITQLSVGATNTVLLGNTGSDPAFGALPIAAITNGSNGQTFIGGGSAATLNTLTQGTGITITNAANSITIAATGSGSSSNAFSAYLSTSVTNVVGQLSTVYTVIFDTEFYDTAGEYNNTTGIFTAASTAKYQFTTAVRLESTIDGSLIPYYKIFIVSTGATYQVSAANGLGGKYSGGTRLGLSGYTQISLTAGDTVKIQVVVNDASGSDSSGLAGSDGFPSYYTYFMGARM